MPEVSRLTQRTIFKVPMTFTDVTKKQTRLLNHRQQLRWSTMDELRPELYRNRGRLVNLRINAPAYSFASFDQDHWHSCSGEIASCGKAGYAGADDDNGAFLPGHGFEFETVELGRVAGPECHHPANSRGRLVFWGWAPNAADGSYKRFAK